MFAYPVQAQVNRALPKSKVYAFAKPGRAVRRRFVEQVDEIIWKYKLAPATVNLPARALSAKTSIEEIQVFEIALRTGEISEDVLRTMDKAIPSLLFFELRFGQQIRFAATYKRPNEADTRKSVVHAYFETPWQSIGEPRTPLPVAVDLASLYEQMLHEHIRLSPFKLLPRKGEALDAMVDRANRIRAKERECRQLETRLKQEIQFNRKVEWNAAVRARRKEIAELQRQ